jgi:hypothetical protein
MRASGVPRCRAISRPVTGGTQVLSVRQCVGQSGVFRTPLPPSTGHQKDGQEEGDGGERKAGGEGAVRRERA